MTYGTDKHSANRSASPVDRAIDGVALRFACEPILMGTSFGLVAGALANSGVVLFAATFLGWALGFYLRRKLDV